MLGNEPFQYSLLHAYSFRLEVDHVPTDFVFFRFTNQFEYSLIGELTGAG